MKRLIQPLLTTAAMALLTTCASGSSRFSAPDVVDHVDIDRYLGTWFDVASFPLQPQRNCVGTSATYSRRDDGDIRVYNRCFQGSFDGNIRDVEGKAWVADPSTNAKLKVQFFWPLRSPYWIVALDDHYQWAVVTTPDRDNLWFLSRTPCMNQSLFIDLYALHAQRGFPMERLRSTPQRADDGTLCQVQLPHH